MCLRLIYANLLILNVFLVVMISQIFYLTVFYRGQSETRTADAPGVGRPRINSLSGLSRCDKVNFSGAFTCSILNSFSIEDRDA